MAVLVDGTTQRGADGKLVWKELSQDEIDRITTLVKSAVGFDEKRGDRVEIVNMRFTAAEELGDPAPSGGFLGVQFGKADLMWLATLGVIGVVALFALIFVARPLAIRLATGSSPAALEASASGAGASGGSLLAGATTPLVAAMPPIDGEDGETMLNVANIEGQMRASSIRQLAGVVESRPDAAMSVMRGWLAQRAV